MKKLWEMTEAEIAAGQLTLARCEHCYGSGTFEQEVLHFGNGSEMVTTTKEVLCGCQDLARELLDEANLPGGRFAGVTLADLDWSALEPAELVPAVQGFAGSLDKYVAAGIGLMMLGKVGTGKTHVAIGLVKLACGLGIGTLFLTMDRLLSRIKATYERRNGHRHAGGEKEEEIIEWLATVPLLALDDLGTERPTEWTCDRLYTIVNRRYLAGRPSIITTNLSLEELSDRLGERTISRLWGTSLILRFQGRDYRERVKARLLKQLST